MKLKICGMKYPENILEVASLQPDYMGFIFWEKSSRYFDGQIPDLPKSIKKTGVFVNESLAIIIEKIIKNNLQAVQLHGKESEDFCLNLKSEFKLKNLNAIEIIKVFSMADDFDFELLKPFESLCDYFLFDTKGKLPGGNGTTFDWNVLENYPSSKPFFLSGGIGLEETAAVHAITKTNLPVYAIDVNSKFEIEPGLKNTELLREFQHNLAL
ncbi:phosphoribosylanthranilate isomerase [Flavobacterium sp. F-380]|uniref:N-(5'-phosphoribosyl)anthranilate isomerase n=1 Tax=Flavobacterium kayseriense TaxID=2764714 RepID=A0ABR7J6A7_9FLAO|nr:phosphoribosylanthranilate isomerase [Flavobacterium kayseriense]MBC5841069.1 phosphoribosylanthranilate isomerase [Flavobacterium kayseriense]MBC5847597.1 phosphoribosylanthranilate isomerase [Flavobacterium kayseriense]